MELGRHPDSFDFISALIVMELSALGERFRLNDLGLRVTVTHSEPTAIQSPNRRRSKPGVRRGRRGQDTFGLNRNLSLSQENNPAPRPTYNPAPRPKLMTRSLAIQQLIRVVSLANMS